MNNILKTILGLNDFIDIKNIPNDIKSVYDNLDYEKFKHYINLFLITQDKLNTKMCGEGYSKSLVTNKNRKIRFGNALLSEANELLDSVNWKHWKDINGKNNTENISVEIIDFLHFLPSLIKVLLDNITIDSNDEDLETIINIAWRELNKNTIINPDNETLEKEVVKLTSAISILGGMANLSGLLNIDMIDTKDEVSDLYFSNILLKLIGTCLGLTFKLHFMVFDSKIEDVWSLYVIKNTLNGFRKDHGYEDGIYDKHWYKDKEDNIVAMEIMKENSSYTVVELYDALEEAYRNREI